MGTIGERIKELRKAKKLTQPQLAEVIGIDQSTVSDIERGASIRAETLIRLADALAVTPEFIVTGQPGKTWPFPDIELLSTVQALTRDQRIEVQGAIRSALAQFARPQIVPAPTPMPPPPMTADEYEKASKRLYGGQPTARKVKPVARKGTAGKSR